MSQKLNTFQRVRELEGWKAVAFAAALLERMLPNYLLFCEVTEYEGAGQYRKTLNSIWEWVGVPKAKINLAAQLEKVEELTPDAADYDFYGVYPALDVAISMSSTLLLMQGEDEGGAVIVSKLSQGSVEAYIDASAEQELSSQEIKQHPLMQWEVELQNELLDLLASAKRNSDTVKRLKQLATEEGVSNIGLEMS